MCSGPGARLRPERTRGVESLEVVLVEGHDPVACVELGDDQARRFECAANPFFLQRLPLVPSWDSSWRQGTDRDPAKTAYAPP